MAVQIGGDIPLGGEVEGWTRARVEADMAAPAEMAVFLLFDCPPEPGSDGTYFTPDEAEKVGRRLIEAAEEARRGD